MPGSSSWIPYAPQGVRGLDDDDDDDDDLHMAETCSCIFINIETNISCST